MKILSRRTLIQATHGGHTGTFEVFYPVLQPRLYPPSRPSNPPLYVVEVSLRSSSGTGETEEEAILDCFRRMGIS